MRSAWVCGLSVAYPRADVVGTREKAPRGGEAVGRRAGRRECEARANMGRESELELLIMKLNDGRE